MLMLTKGTDVGDLLIRQAEIANKPVVYGNADQSWVAFPDGSLFSLDLETSKPVEIVKTFHEAMRKLSQQQVQNIAVIDGGVCGESRVTITKIR